MTPGNVTETRGFPCSSIQTPAQGATLKGAFTDHFPTQAECREEKDFKAGGRRPDRYFRKITLAVAWTVH